ncbi:MAG: aldo/keto reductase [Christensenellales bacterium]|jgi:predicted aldo/keto reductase-like oxidoreductase
MKYRRLGKTNLMVSEVGLGAEWLERHTLEECVAVVKRCEEAGINILDCWMSEPNVRTNLGIAIRENRDKWIVQGHFGSTWKNGQYARTRKLEPVKAAFEDLLTRLQTDYIDIGMIHFVDGEKEWESLQDSDYLKYVFSMKERGIIRHIGLSTHNPEIAKRAILSGYVEMILFSVNPAFDMAPAAEDMSGLFEVGYYTDDMRGINPERAQVYSLAETHDVGITVMKGFAGGRLFDAARSPFGVALTPVQCIHYCLTRPAVASILCGYDTTEHVDAAVAYEHATDAEKDYATVLASAPMHAYMGQCTYCGHCKPCPVDIDIAMVNKFYDLAVLHDEVPETIREHYRSLSHHADECIGCKACEARCPFGVKIAERMEKASALFAQR